MLIGHTLMVGDLGRAELATGAEDGAVCGCSLGGRPCSNIGFEKRRNRVFGIDDEAKSVRAMLADIPPTPPAAARPRAINAGQAATAA